MIRPGLALVLWLATAVLLVANHTIGDTLIATAIGPRDAAWYKVLLPLPYVALMAVIHARRTVGPAWQAGALVAGLLWSTSTVVLDAVYGRLTYGESVEAILDRYALLDGAPWPILLLAQLVLPWLCGLVIAIRKRPADAAGRS
ncbi:hypothetical protein [Reyranella sp. CPCC 100927]|uniref:hypothetical protein n=1 Tax=Reyranella sp. CPCC 100927 TaxID=2599616 RepID=UPI0011B3A529|nr:hypothetical protein [Reyranella sp. CPCC 100927]TWT15670.1 hypothetical protein FQU96_04800 [Reyranella sp. CPCC 100927]